MKKSNNPSTTIENEKRRQKNTILLSNMTITKNNNGLRGRQLTVGLGQSWYGAWKDYKKSLEKKGVKVILLDLYNPGWANRILKKDKQIDFYFWHADTWGENYRRVHDRIYFIENILKKPVFPNMNQYYAYNDKIKQKEIIDYLKLPHIPTKISLDKEESLKIIKKAKYPVIIKDSYWDSGYGVYKVDTKKEAEKIVNKIFKNGYKNTKDYLYIQDFQKNIKKDLRIITLGNKVSTSYWRISENDWKHNITQGADYSFKNIPSEAEKLCLDISKKMNWHWMAYDILMVGGKPKILEWTCNFACKAPIRHGLDIRDNLIDYAISNYEKK